MTKELFEKYALTGNDQMPFLDEEQFYKAMFDYRGWLLQQQVSVEPVKPDFCEWRVVDVGDQYTESIIFASCQHPHTMRERKWGIEIYKYCPHCGKEKKVEKMKVSKNSV